MEIFNSLNNYFKDIKSKNTPNVQKNDSDYIPTINSDKIDIKMFKIFTNKDNIKVSDDIKVPKQLKKVWNELIKDGVLTMLDYEKIVKLSKDLKIDNKSEFQEFIKTIENKLMINKGVISFLEDNEEISLKELNDFLQ